MPGLFSFVDDCVQRRRNTQKGARRENVRLWDELQGMNRAVCGWPGWNKREERCPVRGSRPVEEPEGQTRWTHLKVLAVYHTRGATTAPSYKSVGLKSIFFGQICVLYTSAIFPI